MTINEYISANKSEFYILENMDMTHKPNIGLKGAYEKTLSLIGPVEIDEITDTLTKIYEGTTKLEENFTNPEKIFKKWVDIKKNGGNDKHYEYWLVCFFMSLFTSEIVPVFFETKFDMFVIDTFEDLKVFLGV